MDRLTCVSWPLRTGRLSIRPAANTDVERTWTWRRLPEVGEWVTSAPTDFETYRSRFTDPTRMACQLVIALDDPANAENHSQLIGDIMLRVEDGWAQSEVLHRAHNVQAELGWTLDPAFQGRGYATEALRGVIRTCFETLGLRRVYAGCFAANEPSWRMMERLGMRREEHSRATGLHRSGVWMDGMSYGLLAEEWQAAHIPTGEHRSSTESAGISWDDDAELEIFESLYEWVSHTSGGTQLLRRAAALRVVLGVGSAKSGGR